MAVVTHTCEWCGKRKDKLTRIDLETVYVRKKFFMDTLTNRVEQTPVGESRLFCDSCLKKLDFKKKQKPRAKKLKDAPLFDTP